MGTSESMANKFLEVRHHQKRLKWQIPDPALRSLKFRMPTSAAIIVGEFSL